MVEAISLPPGSSNSSSVIELPHLVGPSVRVEQVKDVREKRQAGEKIKPDSGLTDFDLAYAMEAMARAHALAGMSDESAQYRALAQKLGEAIADEDDKKIFLGDFDGGPWNPNTER